MSLEMQWYNLNNKISENFRWREALYCNQWGVHVFPTKEQRSNIIYIASRLELIREVFKLPIHITSWLRPSAYNTLIGGSRASAHIFGKAVDFIVVGKPSHEIRSYLFDNGYLEKFNIRMERLPYESNWIHIDSNPVGKERYFLP